MGDDATLRDDDVAKELVQPDTESVAEGKDVRVARTLRRSGWRAASDAGQYAASCCRERRSLPTPESPPRGTQVPPQGRLRATTNPISSKLD